MRYEDMPKGRNKDRCVRCGKRYNFADKALSKAKVPYDLLCLAEVTTSGYMTHGNVKLCDECMVELLMWLDHKTEPQTEPLQTCSVNGRPYSECSSCEHFKCTADEPQTECNGCKFVGTYDTEFPCANCSRKTKDYYANDEPQTEVDWKDQMWAEAVEASKDEPQTDEEYINSLPWTEVGNGEQTERSSDD